MPLFGFRRRTTERMLTKLAGENATAEAEVHRYEERLNVTTGWWSGWAIPVPRDAGPAEIGALVQRALEESRRDPDPLFESRESRKRDERHEKAWERFCRDVVGTTSRRYRPEIRIRVYDDGEGTLTVSPFDSTGTPDEEHELELAADVDAGTLGDVVVRLVAETQPRWPTVRRATVATEARGRLVVHPHRGMFLTGPIRILDAAVDERSLGREIGAALAEGSMEEEEEVTSDYYDALEAVGLDERDLQGGAQASIGETSRGAIVVKAFKPSGAGWESADTPEETIEDGDLAAVARAALAQLGQIPTRHRDPNVETGAPWAYKTAWLAVRTEDWASVADALRLTGRRELDWSSGVAVSYDDGIFVTPATSGWTFAVGNGWFDRDPDVAELSGRLGAEAQYFATHRVVDAHTWSLARDGALVRRVWYVGESGELEESGEPTEVEQELGLENLDVDAAIELIDEETVMQVAAAWSIDPRELGTTRTSGRKGVHGKLPHA